MIARPLSSFNKLLVWGSSSSSSSGATPERRLLPVALQIWGEIPHHLNECKSSSRGGVLLWSLPAIIIAFGHYQSFCLLNVPLFGRGPKLISPSRATKANKRQTKNEKHLLRMMMMRWRGDDHQELIVLKLNCILQQMDKWRASEWNVGTANWKNENGTCPPTGWFFNGHNTRDGTLQINWGQWKWVIAVGLLDQVIKCSKPNADGTFTTPTSQLHTQLCVWGQGHKYRRIFFSLFMLIKVLNGNRTLSHRLLNHLLS